MSTGVIGQRVSVPYRVAFGDTDASGRIYWGSVFRLFECAESELWRSLGAMDVYGWLPRARVEADYVKPLSFDDELIVSAELAAVGSASAEVRFLVERDGETVGRGRAFVVYVDVEGAPRSLAERLELT